MFRARGWEAETVDLIDGQDVRDWEPIGHYDLIWASPPCELFSVAGHFKHWTMEHGVLTPRDQRAIDALDLLYMTRKKMLDSKSQFAFIENPRGLMRKAILFSEPETTWWCQWGDERAKPTDIWALRGWPSGITPLPICHNGANDHARAPRGAKTGTQGRKGVLERSRIPVAFTTRLAECIEAEVRGPKRLQGAISYNGRKQK